MRARFVTVPATTAVLATGCAAAAQFVGARFVEIAGAGHTPAAVAAIVRDRHA